MLELEHYEKQCLFWGLQVILDFIWKIDISKKLKNKSQGIAAGFGNFKVKNR